MLLYRTMAELVITTFPDALHARIQRAAAAHRRTVSQQTILLLESALAVEEKPPEPSAEPSYRANRPLLPEYAEALRQGAFGGTIDSTAIVSEDRFSQLHQNHANQ